MNQELALKVVSYIADYLGNLPDDSISGFENYTNDEIDAVVGIVVIVQVVRPVVPCLMHQISRGIPVKKV